jgi:hypothetical protein
MLRAGRTALSSAVDKDAAALLQITLIYKTLCSCITVILQHVYCGRYDCHKCRVGGVRVLHVLWQAPEICQQ